MNEAEVLMQGGSSSGRIPDAAETVNEDWYVPKHRGARYYSVLAGLHEALNPGSYLEVGIRQGHSLALARCASIGIDPRFELTIECRNNKPALHLFETTSDKFFAENDALALLGRTHIDFFFLDGAHLSEYLLRDIINSERLAAPKSMIALHDCVPIDIAMTLSRDQRKITPFPVVYPNFWAGDVWRVIMMLKKYRPDITMHCMDAHPTGLVLLTDLDPTSTVLSTNYEQIVSEMKSLELVKIGLRPYIASLPVLPTSEFIGVANLRKRFAPWTDAVAVA